MSARRPLRVAAFACVALVAPLALSAAVRIDHQPPECVVAGRFPRLSACFAPAEELARARVYYTFDGSKWRHATMAPVGSCFSAVLPRVPAGGTVFRYHVQAVDTGVRAERSPEYAPVVVKNASQCHGSVAQFVEGHAGTEAQGKRRNLLLPLLLVVGGGVASAGVAVASRGGETPVGPASTTTSLATVPPGSGPGTTTTTVATGPEPTTPGPTTTSTTTPPASTTSSTTMTTSTTTTMPTCQYALSPNRQFGIAAGTGVCNVSTNAQSCGWTVEVFPASASSWLRLEGAVSGVGNGGVGYSVTALLAGSRSAQIQALQNPGAMCAITQDALLGAPSDGRLAWTTQLEVPGGVGHVSFNGVEARCREGAMLGHATTARHGMNRAEGQLIEGNGRPGAWRFEIHSGYQPGSLRVIAGQATLAGNNGVVFQLSGRPGERVAFTFRSAR